MNYKVGMPAHEKFKMKIDDLLIRESRYFDISYKVLSLDEQSLIAVVLITRNEKSIKIKFAWLDDGLNVMIKGKWYVTHIADESVKFFWVAISRLMNQRTKKNV